MKRMLINATHKKELRIALVDGQRLYNLDIESIGRKHKKANIYKGKITRVEPSLEAAFVDYGTEKHGFLPLKEISKNYYPLEYTCLHRPNIKDILQKGQEIIVQINKEERGNKGAALTTFISLAGSYLVLMPNNPHVEGISRRIDGMERNILKEMLSLLQLPSHMGLIIRTAGVGKSTRDLQLDLHFRLQHWMTIKKEAESRSAPFLIHQESNIIVRAFRDYLYNDVKEILIDDQKTLNLARHYIMLLGRLDFYKKIKLYVGENPLFSYYQIESQIRSAFQRKVRLPSGGMLIIDTVEALTAIDINSARSTNGIDIEETAFHTNLEAVYEIALQLRLRDVGGLIVVDFIDMLLIKNQRIIENQLRETMRNDRAKVQIGNISRFGLLEMSRQQLSSSLVKSNFYTCPKCKGNGTIKDHESFSVLRLIKEELFKNNIIIYAIFVFVSIVAIYCFLNKQKNLTNIIKINKNKKIAIIMNNLIKVSNHFFLHAKYRKKCIINNNIFKIYNIEKNVF